MTATVIRLPVPPPSVNAMYRNVPGLGRRKTKAYREWAATSALIVKAQRPLAYACRVSVAVALPPSVKGDCDNRLKGLLDLLQAAGVLANDMLADPVSIGRDPSVTETTVTITPREA